MHSLKDEADFLFSGKGMPYEKVSIVVAIVTVILMGLLLGNNYNKDVNVAVIDLDNSRYSRELVELIDASPYIRVSAVLNVPAEPKSLMYRDKNVAVLYLPKDLEKNRYSQSLANVGVFYDNTNSAQTGELKAALNTIIAEESMKIAVENAPMAGEMPGVSMHERELFNPVNSSSNGEVLAFLFFFSHMFFVFATIGIVPRLRLEKKLANELETGSPFSLASRLVPYGICLITALFIGMAVLRVFGDLVFSGNVLLFLLSMVVYVPALGMMTLLFGWTAANPGVASSRMILFIPGGFIFGGATGPITILSDWARSVTHFFPLTWQYEFTRDIIARGASFMDCTKNFGGLLLYLAAISLVFGICFYRARTNLIKQQVHESSSIAEG